MATKVGEKDQQTYLKQGTSGEVSIFDILLLIEAPCAFDSLTTPCSAFSGDPALPLGTPGCHL
jgi:hypothetical protein